MTYTRELITQVLDAYTHCIVTVLTKFRKADAGGGNDGDGDGDGGDNDEEHTCAVSTLSLPPVSTQRTKMTAVLQVGRITLQESRNNCKWALTLSLPRTDKWSV